MVSFLTWIIHVINEGWYSEMTAFYAFKMIQLRSQHSLAVRTYFQTAFEDQLAYYIKKYLHNMWHREGIDKEKHIDPSQRKPHQINENAFLKNVVFIVGFVWQYIFGNRYFNRNCWCLMEVDTLCTARGGNTYHMEL